MRVCFTRRAVGTWQQNSRVIHATSKTPGGSYKRKDVTWEVFSHEPEVVPAPGGKYVMYFTAQLRSQHGLCNCCRPGHGPCDGSTGAGDCGHGDQLQDSAASASGSYMSYTDDPNGNWSTPQLMFEHYKVGACLMYARLELLIHHPHLRLRDAMSFIIFISSGWRH